MRPDKKNVSAATKQKQKQLVGSIKESSDRLLDITGELLNLTQVESGKLQLHPKIVKPIELITPALGACIGRNVTFSVGYQSQNISSGGLSVSFGAVLMRIGVMF